MRSYIFVRSIRIIAALSAATISATLLAASPDDVRAALASRFTLTQRSMLSGRVTKPGSVMVIQREGINADPETKLTLKPVMISGDRVENPGGGSLLGGETGRSLKPGDKVYVYEIRPGKNDVVLIYGTTSAYDYVSNGSTQSMSYKGALAFQYPAGLSATEPTKVADDVSLWLKTEAESVAVNTVKLGQTPDEVTRILGSPERQVDLGAKKVFIYKDMKVVFVDGKVADVQ